MSQESSKKAAGQETTKAVQLPKRGLMIEFWVGLFALVGCLCFAYLAVNIARIRLSDSGYYRVQAQFTNISGLKLGAPVEIAGVEVGAVEEVNLNGTEAMVTMQILDEIKLRDDDIAQIRTKGIIGDKFVKISPGGSDMTLNDGDRLSDTESAVDFEDVLGKFIHSLDKDDSKDKDPADKDAVEKEPA